jgi:serine/threonine protein kinase
MSGSRSVSAVRCPACGHDNKPGARFCAYCGALLEAEPATLQPGQFVDGGSYQILRPLGKGGMGAVYLAANTRAFDRPCVVKEVIEYYDPNDPTERRKAMERFESEARMLASLKHPGIPDIYSYFSEGGRNYLVMEYIEGPNLAQGLTREKDGQLVSGVPLPVEDVVRYAIQMCEVLIYLEQRQPPVMHNDIKPANIILDKNSGQAVLVDFGTAKTRYARQAMGQPGRQQSSVYGTVGYAAPELYEGKAEPRSDVYALAATCYHLLTDDDPRDHPFKFPKMDTLPESLRAILRAALQVKVEERLSAVEFKEQLLATTTAEVRVTLPEIEVKPAQVDLGIVPEGEVFSEIRTFAVRNEGQHTLVAKCTSCRGQQPVTALHWRSRHRGPSPRKYRSPCRQGRQRDEGGAWALL